MTSKELIVLNRAGIHARPAAQIAMKASGYASDISFERDSMKINAKSIMGIITLGATYKIEFTQLCARRKQLFIAAVQSGGSQTADSGKE